MCEDLNPLMDHAVWNSLSKKLYLGRWTHYTLQVLTQSQDFRMLWWNVNDWSKTRIISRKKTLIFVGNESRSTEQIYDLMRVGAKPNLTTILVLTRYTERERERLNSYPFSKLPNFKMLNLYNSIVWLISIVKTALHGILMAREGKFDWEWYG